MEHPHVVGGRDGLRQVDHHAQAGGKRNGGQASLSFRPFGEVGAAEFALEVERRRLEAPLEDTDEVGPFAEGVLEEPGEGDFAFEALEADAIARELEDAGLVGFGMRGEPHFARCGVVQLADEAPLVASRDGLAGLEAELAGGRRAHHLALDRDCQAVADPGDGEDDWGIVVAQGLAQFGDGGGERALHHGDAGPGRFQQLFFGHHLSGVEEQLTEDFEGLGFQLDEGSLRAQLAAGFVEFEMREAPDPAGDFPFAPAIRIGGHRLIVL